MRKYILIILALLLIIAIFINFQSKKKLVALKNDLDKQEALIRKFQDEAGVVAGAIALTKLEMTNVLKDKELKKAEALFDSKQKGLPVDISDKGIYFFESLHTTMKLLERKATLKKMIVPPVDFSVDIPREEDIPFLLKQIEMIEDIMGIIIDAGKCEVITIKPNPIDNTKIFFGFNEVNVQIVLEINSDSFIKVLSDFNSHIPLYLIEELSISSIEQNRLKVSFVAFRIISGLSLQDIDEFKNKEIFDLTSLYPLDIDFDSFSKRNPFFRFRESQEGASSVSGKETISTPQFTYKGTIYLKGKLVGIIEDNWQDKICFVELGDVCSGYKVVQIEEKKAILTKDEQEIILLKGVK